MATKILVQKFTSSSQVAKLFSNVSNEKLPRAAAAALGQKKKTVICRGEEILCRWPLRWRFSLSKSGPRGARVVNGLRVGNQNQGLGRKKTVLLLMAIVVAIIGLLLEIRNILLSIPYHQL